jgi:hypothetical protein
MTRRRLRGGGETGSVVSSAPAGSGGPDAAENPEEFPVGSYSGDLWEAGRQQADAEANQLLRGAGRGARQVVF